MAGGCNGCTLCIINAFLIIGVVVLSVIVVAVLIAWTYAKSSQAQTAEELEDNDSIEGWKFYYTEGFDSFEFLLLNS